MRFLRLTLLTLAAAYCTVFGSERMRFQEAFRISGGLLGSAAQDKDGFLLFGTRSSGLAIYDGSAVRYIKAGANSLPSNGVTSIFVDDEGLIWLGTFAGLCTYNKNTGIIRTFKHDPNNPVTLANDALSDSVRAIVQGPQGYIWIATQNGLSRYDKKTKQFKNFVHHPKLPGSLPGNNILFLFFDSNNTLWVSVRNSGLSKYDPQNETFTHYRHDPDTPYSLPTNRLYSIAEDDLGHLWLGTNKEGLIRFNPQNESFKHFQHNPKNSNSIPDLFWRRINWIDSLSKICPSFAIEAIGLVLVDTNGKTHAVYNREADNKHSLATNTVNFVYEDASNILWIGHMSGLISKI